VLIFNISKVQSQISLGKNGNISMTQNVNIYMGGVKVATGVATAGSATIGTFAEVSGLASGRFNPGTKAANNKGWIGERVEIHSTSGANATGKAYQTTIVEDNNTSIVISDKHPYSD
jgi:membrane protease subunit (stomatin/prohibitin family)